MKIKKRNLTIFFIVIFWYPLLFDRTLIIKLKKFLKQGYVDLIKIMPKFHSDYLEKIFDEKFNEISKDKLKKIGYTELKKKNIFVLKKILHKTKLKSFVFWEINP